MIDDDGEGDLNEIIEMKEERSVCCHSPALTVNCDVSS
jgi:hypothetical protein